ncbi:GNAT family N-acetyltransferase [Bifidobacterium psychraerophilum]|uniref:GNAT family N-acetyltransferase n=1 Tax=Bifidobacterium psychraerophilum TaxID=218140 RepID=UPI003342ABA4
MERIETDIRPSGGLAAVDLLEVMAERTRVFVVEQHCPYQEVDEKDWGAVHVMLRIGGALAAYARVVPHDDGVHHSIGRVLTVKRFRGRGLATKVVQASITEIERRYPGRGIKIAAQSYLEEFYGHFGFMPVSEVYLEDGIPHIDMVLGHDGGEGPDGQRE